MIFTLSTFYNTKHYLSMTIKKHTQRYILDNKSLSYDLQFSQRPFVAGYCFLIASYNLDIWGLGHATPKCSNIEYFKAKEFKKQQKQKGLSVTL